MIHDSFMTDFLSDERDMGHVAVAVACNRPV